MNHHPVKAIRDLAKDYYGDFENDAGVLRLTFSIEASGESGIKRMLSELYTTGALDGDPAGLPFNIVDELSHDYATDLAPNASVKLGANPDHVIVEIGSMALVAD